MIALGMLFGGALTALLLALYGTHLVLHEMARPPAPHFSRNAQAFGGYDYHRDLAELARENGVAPR